MRKLKQILSIVGFQRKRSVNAQERSGDFLEAAGRLVKEYEETGDPQLLVSSECLLEMALDEMTMKQKLENH